MGLHTNGTVPARSRNGRPHAHQAPQSGGSSPAAPADPDGDAHRGGITPFPVSDSAVSQADGAA